VVTAIALARWTVRFGSVGKSIVRAPASGRCMRRKQVPSRPDGATRIHAPAPSATPRRRVANMTFEEARRTSRLAFRPLPNGALLRYQPEDGTVRVLAYPHRVEEWTQLPVIRESIPSDDWRHLPQCPCGACRARDADQQWGAAAVMHPGERREDNGSPGRS